MLLAREKKNLRSVFEKVLIELESRVVNPAKLAAKCPEYFMICALFYKLAARVPDNHFNIITFQFVFYFPFFLSLSF